MKPVPIFNHGSPRSLLPALALSMLGATANGGEATYGTPQGQTPRPLVAVDLISCTGVSETDLRRILGVEVGDLLVDGTRPVPPDSNRLVIRCDADSDIVYVEARDGRSSRRVSRVLRLGDFPPDAAARALALAGIETVAALDPGVRQRVEARKGPDGVEARKGPDGVEARKGPDEPPMPIPAEPPPPTPKQQTPSTSEPRQETPEMGKSFPGSHSAQAMPVRHGYVQTTLSGARRMFVASGGSSLWGGALGVDAAIRAPFALGADIEVSGARAAVPLGQASGLIVSGSGYFGVRSEISRVTGILALGGRVGVAHLAGDPIDNSGSHGNPDTMGNSSTLGRSVLRPWAGPAVSVRLLGAFGHLALQASAELGHTILGADGLADHTKILSVSGPWVACSLGAGVRY